MLANHLMTRLAVENEGLDMTDSRSHKRMNGTPGESAERDGSDTGMPSDLPKLLYFFEAGLRSNRISLFLNGQLLELQGAAYSWTGKANYQFDQESLESSLSFPKFRLARLYCFSRPGIVLVKVYA